jgi:hypothetical protein
VTAVRFLYVTKEAALLELDGRMPIEPREEMLVCPDGVHSFRVSVVSWHLARGVDVMLEHPSGNGEEHRLGNAQLVGAGWLAVGMREPKKAAR